MAIKSDLPPAAVEMATDRLEDEETFWQVAKRSPKIILFSSMTAIAPVMFGFDNIIVSLVTAMPIFQMMFGTEFNGSFIIPALWLGLWNAFVQLGIMIGAAGNGILIDKYGRRSGFIVGGLISTGAIGCIYASTQPSTLEARRAVFLVGKTILGIALGILLASSQTYISEVAPTKLRGPLLSMYSFFMACGQIIAVSLIFQRIAHFEPSAFLVPFASQWAFALFSILVGFMIPESPMYHLRGNRIEKAESAFQRLQSGFSNPDEFAALRRSLEVEQEIEGANRDARFADCFKGSDRRRTRIIVWANILQQLLGITLISNSTYFLELAGMSPNLSLTLSQVGISVILIANIISWYTMTRFGRRRIMLVSCVVVGLQWLSIGIAGCFNSPAALWYIGVCIMVVGFCIQSGVGSAWPVVSGETSSIRLRSKSQAIGWLVNAFASWLFNFVLPYLFNTNEANLGGKLGFIFAGLCVFGFAIVWFEIPEMKNRSYHILDEMFALGLPTRKFKSYSSAIDGPVKAVDDVDEDKTENWQHQE